VPSKLPKKNEKNGEKEKKKLSIPLPIHPRTVEEFLGHTQQ
jgi:hypothetical protein